ncbi:MAG: sugar ABC transporter ATP-binding protein [Clostridia bacterium]|nr:sugar ABC transporter ATP-binding protein [Clostridia bacterium]
MSGEALLTMTHIHKSFGPTKALRDVSLRVNRGEIRGLVGENGSGKSTVTSIAAGMQPPTSGEMRFLGAPWRPQSMVAAQRAGLAMILQEANTIPHVTVAENIFAGRESEFSRAGLMHMRRMIAAADEALRRFGIEHIRARDSIDRYSFEDRKLIELARCVDERTELLVIDETTTALSHDGRRILYRLIHELAEKRNKAVVFISHDIEEVLRECSVVTVLRDGQIIGDLTRAEMDAPDARQKIRYMMVGREIGESYYREDYDGAHGDREALTFNNVCFGPIQNFNLTLHEGEIVGIGGLSGSGMHEIGRAGYGLEKLDAGSVTRHGKAIRSPAAAIANGVGYISKNRDGEALILEGSIADNIVLPSLPALEKRFTISPAKERALAKREIEAFRIKCGSGRQWVNTLSGGNKQKVSFAKWDAKGAAVLIMDCPTRGVDVGVKQAMYALIAQMKREGKAVLMISEELAELIGMADRLIVMKDFAVSKEFERSGELRQTDIIQYML